MTVNKIVSVQSECGTQAKFKLCAKKTWFSILAMAPSPVDEAETSLKATKYRDLQKIAKEVGVKANLARPLLIQKILAAKFPDLPALRQHSSLRKDLGWT